MKKKIAEFEIKNNFLYHFCGARTVKIRDDTSLINFSVYCDKCKQEYLVNIVNGKLISPMLEWKGSDNGA